MTDAGRLVRRDTILYGGLVVGLLDACDAVLFFGARGTSPQIIAQSVASGVLGRASFDGGVASVVVGVVMHFLVATCIAAVFALLMPRIPALAQHPVIGGLVFGAAAFFVMRFGVVRLSRAANQPWPTWPVLINGVVGHALLVGLPIALIAARSLRLRSRDRAR